MKDCFDFLEHFLQRHDHFGPALGIGGSGIQGVDDLDLPL
jgi:hypothetical protein